MNIYTRHMRPLARTAAVVATALAIVMVVSAARAAAPNISCGDTITKNTKLNHDLIDCPGNGIVIGHGKITLDLNGHRIVGDGSFLGNGVDNSAGYDQVTIKNGTILEFERGVYLQSASFNRVSGLLVTSNRTNGIELLQSHHNSIQHNEAVATEEGIVVGGSNANIVDSNFSLANDGEGIAVENSSSNNRVTGNVSIGNEFGILVDSTGSVHNLIGGNIVNRNGIPDPVDPSPPPPTDGIYIGDATTVVRANTANNNGAFGIGAFFGAIDGGGNKARGNGEAAQCLNVVCL